MRISDWSSDVCTSDLTRIKLMPDAHSKIDVTMIKDGDTMYVSFTADVAATRALLAEAKPRLAELAQQRWLRLGQRSEERRVEKAQARTWKSGCRPLHQKKNINGQSGTMTL